MLAIRMQRTGRKGHAQFRMIVQEAHLTPTSGRVVAWLGSYDPHAKTSNVDKEKAAFYLEHGAQPSERVARLLKKEGVKLPKWVNKADAKTRTVRQPEKLRKNRPAEEPTPEPVATEATKETEESKKPVAADEAEAAQETEAAAIPAEAEETEKIETTDKA